MAKGTVITTLSEWLVVALILFSLAFEFLLHHFEHWLARKHAHLQPAVKIVYREVMVLGLISFLFITYQQIAKPTGDVILSFEFAHVFIFLFAIFYIVVVLFSLYTSLHLSARWKSMEAVSLGDYIACKDEYTAMRLRMHSKNSPYWRVVRWWFPNFTLLARYRYLHELVAFHDARFQYIFYQKLPESFRFSSFLRKLKSTTFIRLVDSHWSLYVIFLVGVVFDIIRRYSVGVAVAHFLIQVRAEDDEDTKPFKTDIVESSFIIATSCILIILIQILALKIRRVYWHLTKNPRLYHQDLNIEELDNGDTSNDQPAHRVSLTLARRSLPHSPASPLGLENPEHASPILAHVARRSLPHPPASSLGLQNPEHASPILAHVARRSLPHPPASPLGLQNPEHASPILTHAAKSKVLKSERSGDTDGSEVTASRGNSASDTAGPKDLAGVTFDALEIGKAAIPTTQRSSKSNGDDAEADRGEPHDIEQGIAPSNDTSEQPESHHHHHHHLPHHLPHPHLHLNALVKHKSLAVTNDTIAANRKQQEDAKQEKARTYPWLIRKLVPRVNRVASPAEKLFWFGSHHFFLWGVEFTLFFTTVLMSASLGAIILLWMEGNPIIHVNIAALALASVTLLFVLVRSAGILKKYTFVLLSASLVPDEIAEDAIRKTSAKSKRLADSSSDEELEQGDEPAEPSREAEPAEKPDDAGVRSGLMRRKTITQFMRNNNSADGL